MKLIFQKKINVARQIRNSTIEYLNAQAAKESFFQPQRRLTSRKGASGEAFSGLYLAVKMKPCSCALTLNIGLSA